ncbi:hypothetical protein KA405_03310 [Patescibacteria group bacterium]|nr:hypothetical protein [Patescibacteria group bacterium]
MLDAYCENSQDEEVKKDIWKYINNSDESVRYLKMHLRWSEERLQHIIKNRSSNDFYLYFQDLQTEKSVLNWEKDLKTQR